MRAKLFITFVVLLLTTSLSQAQDALDLYVEATSYVKEGRFDEALQKFDDAIRKDGTNHKFYYEKARLQFKMKQSEAAVATMKKAIENQEDHLDSHLVLARYYRYSKQYEEAIIYFDNSFKYAKDKEEKYKYKLEIIEILDRELNQLEKAGNHINDLKQVAPNDPTALYYEAKYYNAIEDYAKARDAATKGTQTVADKGLDQKAAMYFELGTAFYNLENYDKMAEAFEVAGQSPKFRKDIQRMSPQYFFMLAISYYKVYEIKEAEKLIIKTLKMRPDFSRAHELQVKIADSQIEKSLVIQHQKNAIEAETNMVKRAEKYADLSELELQSGRYEDAVKSANACLAVEPKNYAVTFFKGVSQYKMGKVQDAIATLTELVSYRGIDPETKSQYNFALGLFYERIANETGDASAKKQAIRQALEAYKAANYGTFRFIAQEKISELTH